MNERVEESSWLPVKGGSTAEGPSGGSDSGVWASEQRRDPLYGSALSLYWEGRGRRSGRGKSDPGAAHPAESEAAALEGLKQGQDRFGQQGQEQPKEQGQRKTLLHERCFLSGAWCLPGTIAAESRLMPGGRVPREEG